MPKDERIEMAKSYLSGQSFKDIAKDTGMDHRTIAKRIREVSLKALKLYEAIDEMK